MLSPVFWLAFAGLFWLLKSIVQVGLSIDPVRAGRIEPSLTAAPEPALAPPAAEVALKRVA